jgi:hypothetical protein
MQISPPLILGGVAKGSFMKIYVNKLFFFVPGNEMPDISFIPSMQRRKMSRLTCLVLGIAAGIAPEGREIPLVYASRFGEWGQTLKQMLRFFEEREISPVGFGFSVHNTAPAQYSIQKNNHKAYTAISGSAHTFDAGLTEAAAMLIAEEEVLYVCAEEGAPEIYRGAIKEETSEYAIGLRIGRVQAEDGAMPLVVDFKARNNVSGGNHSRAVAFMHFLGSDAPSFDGPHCSLHR